MIQLLISFVNFCLLFKKIKNEIRGQHVASV